MLLMSPAIAIRDNDRIVCMYPRMQGHTRKHLDRSSMGTEASVTEVLELCKFKVFLYFNFVTPQSPMKDISHD